MSDNSNINSLDTNNEIPNPDVQSSGAEAPTMQKRLLSEVIDWIEAIVFALVVVAIVFSFLFRIVIVSGHSMDQTLNDADKVILNSTFYTPKVGDIVVAAGQDINNNTPIIKRVIATEGQKVKIDFDEGIVYVDGQALDEPYTNTPTNKPESWNDDELYIKDADGYVTVPQGCLFIMGDNRNNSKDSRDASIGFVKKNEVRHAFFRIFPLNKFGFLKNPNDK